MFRTAVTTVLLMTGVALAADKPKPLMRDFMGLNTHTVQHKPELYKDIAHHLRDYHGINWDLGDESDYKPTFPMSRNKVDWKNDVYAKWRAVGATVDVSLMFEQIPADKWKDLDRDAAAYGKAFAGYFGPSHENLVQYLEIGNEPGGFSDADYRRMFIAMSRGLRAGDPKLKVVTANMTIHKSDKYSKNVDCVKGLDFDILNTHTYAQLEPYPTWRRSYPEDPRLKYLTDVEGLIAWRNNNAPGKPVWITEFGYDSTTQPNFKEGTFKDWVGNTDTEQAQYIVRSWLVFAAMDVDRAYLYWFNDNDTPHLHASSGLTRSKKKPAGDKAQKKPKSPADEKWPEYEPKPSYWAVKHLQATLGDYRFSKVIEKKAGEVYVYEFAHDTEPGRKVYVAWSPTAAVEAKVRSIPIRGKVESIERMPLADGPVPQEKAEIKSEPDQSSGVVNIAIDASPVFIRVK